MTPEETAEFVRLAAPAFTAGMLALVTALVVFGAQQRAARKAAREARLNQAFEHMMDGFRAVQDGVRDLSRTQTPDDLADSVMRFSWLLAKKDQALAVWLGMKGNEVMKIIQNTPDVNQRRVEVGVLKGDVAATLRGWRDGVISRRQIFADIERLGRELKLMPSDLGVSKRPEVPGHA